MRVTRRQFIQAVGASAAALGIGQLQLMKLTEVLAKDGASVQIIWLHGQNCTGCTTSFAGLEWDGKPEGLPSEITTYLGLPQTLGGVLEPDNLTTIDDVLLDIVDLKFLTTIMATAGEEAYDILKAAMSSWTATHKLLVVEGSIPVNGEKYCTIAADKDGTDELWVGEVVEAIARNATAVVACGTCASFGGIPAAGSDAAYAKTGATDATTFLSTRVPPVSTPVVKVPGCPIHPDWLFGTIVHYLLGDLLTNLDGFGRPTAYYGTPIHGGRCLRYQAYCDGQLADYPGQAPSDDGRVYQGTITPYDRPLCLIDLGCKGVSTNSDCAFGGPGTKGRGWNVYSRDASSNPTSGGSCINNGYPCMGCTEKGYPDKYSPFFAY